MKDHKSFARLIDCYRHRRRNRAFLGAFVLVSAILVSTDGAVAQKTDVVVLLNGDAVTGEIKELKRGKIRFSTDAMGTVYVEWPKIRTLTTDKIFDIELTDGARIFGSMRPAEEPNRVELIAERDTLVVATQSIVAPTSSKLGDAPSRGSSELLTEQPCE